MNRRSKFTQANLERSLYHHKLIYHYLNLYDKLIDMTSSNPEWEKLYKEWDDIREILIKAGIL